VPPAPRERPAAAVAPVPAVGPAPERPQAGAGDEYEGIGAFAVLPLLSLACFAAALGARYLVGFLPAELRPLPRPFLSALASPAFALLGLLLALPGLRSRTGRGLARLALWLNGVALVFGALLVAAFFYIYPAPLRWLFGIGQ
jgi:hypothetical protein